MRSRTLSLKRETLAELSAAEMTSVAGGSHACPIGHGPSFDEPCEIPTLPLTPCVNEITTIFGQTK
jgi:hypothetical protein